MNAPVHRPVLVRETMEALAPSAGAMLLDGTVGLGGHAGAWLRATAAAGGLGRVVGLDRDPAAVRIAAERLEGEFPGRATVRHASYEDAAGVCREIGAEPDAALLDLGASSMQLDDAARGFSFQAPGPLDMRMDSASGGETAADVVNRRSEADLERIFADYGEEPAAARVARALVADRQKAPFRDTLRLAESVSRAVGGRKGRLHPATRVFQALRIEVNDELGRVRRGLPAVASVLRDGGRLAVLTFHRLEDREAKRFLEDGERRGALSLLPDALPAPSEVASNPRSRSARLRAALVTARHRLPEVA
ncbi:MAG: Ribosomal RNA small subunit methyltransferase H [Planctomycetes bacterium]|nr:Ribosomal RNA small subunit methyltransferase H [Planctomycetota bacterium]